MASEGLQAERELLDAIRVRRAALIEQINQSQKTIESSRALLRQLDKLLADAEENPRPPKLAVF